MTTEELTALQKVELHCHLDGSLSRGFIEKRLGREVSQSELSVSEDCRSLNERKKFPCLMHLFSHNLFNSSKYSSVCFIITYPSFLHNTDIFYI